ncbi:hypothetical protein [Halobacterium zhouii]|uniref:hypothetical protein n=1 Tax=Halobacterium zhouii TaxID=2902624 RepID=UPI001E2B7B9F|nr:hypothetical protein [Halobacterium zhouii]
MNRYGVRLLQLLVVAGGAVVVTCSAWPWVTNGHWLMYLAGIESGLEIQGSLTRSLGWLVVAAGVLAVRSRVARIVGFVAGAGALIVAAQLATEFHNSAGVAPTDGLLLVVAGAAASVVGFVMIGLRAQSQFATVRRTTIRQPGT